MFRPSDTKTLQLDALMSDTGDSWAFTGSNDNGKSVLTHALVDELPLLKGKRHCQFTRITRLSSEQFQKLVSDEWQRNNTDLLSPGEDDSRHMTARIIQGEVHDSVRCAALVRQFDISSLLNRHFKYLSTGEMYKTLLCQASISTPDLLILDEPFGGLDVVPRHQLAELLTELYQAGSTLVLVPSRFDEIPEFMQSVGVLAGCTLTETSAKPDLLQQALITQLVHSERLEGVQLPESDGPSVRHVLSDSELHIVLDNGTVSCDGRPILHHPNWRVNPGEHWQIIGSNGTGKSTLLSLIAGDHPQEYSNGLALFGRRRGSGETIWDIRRHIGYVSNDLHLDYRVSTAIRNVILFGYFDSIGTYQAISDRQYKPVQQWPNILSIDERTADAPSHGLSWGQQQLASIVRTLMKHSTLLISDESLQGLDPLNRQLIHRLANILIGEDKTQLLFVSHYAEDAPTCITHRLELVPEGDIYTYRQTSLR